MYSCERPPHLVLEEALGIACGCLRGVESSTVKLHFSQHHLPSGRPTGAGQAP